MAQAQVALVNMPFGTAFGPSLGLSLLKAALQRRGVPTKVFYPALWFAQQTKDPYAVWEMIQCRPSIVDMAGEWIFSEACFGPDAAADDRYLNEVLRGGHRAEPVPEALIQRIAGLQQEATPFIDRCLEAVDWGQFAVVGFTSVFQQTLASVALARRIKERYPHVLIAFGGANCESDMGLALFRHFDCIDLVCSGEGDVAFPEAVVRYLNGEPIGLIPGILHRGPELAPVLSGELAGIPLHTKSVEEMDELPFPDCDDYFEQFTTHGAHEGWPVYLYFETSRGCWWGAKNHCTFCGLNGQGMSFRSKSSERALAELRYLKSRYQKYRVTYQAVDNILDYRYMADFLPGLKEIGLQGDLFYEVKANLSEAQVRALADAGIRNIQPGIESLSTPILRLMRKGVTRLQNIQLLKWCKQYGVKPFWNLLTGFPGEPEAEYAEMAALIPSLTHLDPPQNAGTLRFDRFSPYFMAPEAHGLSDLRPFPSYGLVFRGLPETALSQIAYFFLADFPGQERVATYTRPVREQVAAWREAHEGAALHSFVVGEHLIVRDLRPSQGDREYRLTGLHRYMLEAAEQIIGEAAIGRQAGQRLERQIEHAELREALAFLTDRRLLLREGDQYLSLIVPIMEETLEPADQADLAALRSHLEVEMALLAGQGSSPVAEAP